MELSARNLLERTFPNLNPSDYTITSPRDPKYNCIAWAVGDSGKWWEPDAMGINYWPDGVEREYSLNAIKAALKSLSYKECDSDSFEPGFVKVAVFVRTLPPHVVHMSRQIGNGLWTSKIGRDVDIEHSLKGLVGDHFGSVVCILKKPA